LPFHFRNKTIKQSGKNIIEMERKEVKPLKRHKDLQPISRDHHHSLLLSWKIRQGFKKGIAPVRIKKYCDWFFVTHIVPHFEIEEEYIFPILGENNELVKKALSEHRRLIKLFSDEDDYERSLSLLEEELESHIRFEERVLFTEVQTVASADQLKAIKLIHKEGEFIDNKADEFWLP
jgi:hemerythrin-like domain-containing protein